MDQIIKEWALIITAIITAATLLWRYLLGPVAKFLRKSGHNSGAIADAFPALLATFKHWPSPLGAGSIIGEIERIDQLADITHARMLALLDQKDVAIFECDPSGECIHANRSLCNLFEMSRSDMIGNGWLEGILPADRITVFNVWRETIGAMVPYESTYTVRGVDSGKLTRAKVMAVPLRNRHGEVVSYFGTVQPLPESE
jgi:PAS domain S-box-containing protein